MKDKQIKELFKTAPVSDLRKRQDAVFKAAGDEPVVLLSRNQPVGVLLSPALWNKIVHQLEEQQDIIDVLETQFAVAQGDDEIVDVDIEELEREIGDLQATLGQARAPESTQRPRPNQTGTSANGSRPTTRPVPARR